MSQLEKYFVEDFRLGLKAASSALAALGVGMIKVWKDRREKAGSSRDEAARQNDEAQLTGSVIALVGTLSVVVQGFDHFVEQLLVGGVFLDAKLDGVTA